MTNVHHAKAIIDAMRARDAARASLEAAERTVRSLMAAADMPSRELIGSKAAARLAGISERQLRRLAESGCVGERINGRWRYDPGKLAERFRAP